MGQLLRNSPAWPPFSSLGAKQESCWVLFQLLLSSLWLEPFLEMGLWEHPLCHPVGSAEWPVALSPKSSGLSSRGEGGS